MGLLAIIGLVSAVFMISSPKEVRLQKLDRDKVDFMQNLTYEIDSYYRFNEDLPATLEEVTDNPTYGYMTKTNDQVYQVITYNVIDGEKGKYSLCATFEASSRNENRYYYDHQWNHEAGYQCFDLKVSEY